jgi:hypothetical protein
MADIRINSLPTTASASSSDDFLALDGATNGTRKLNAYSPTFGGNVTASGNLTVSGVTTSAGISNSGALTFTAAIGQVAGSIAKNATYGLTQYGVTGSSNDNTLLNAAGAVVLANPAGTVNATLAGNLTVSGGAAGIGVSPYSWTAYKWLDLQTRGLGLAGSEDSGAISVNAYYSSGWKYKGTSSYKVADLELFDGSFIFNNAAAGTANGAITWTQAMTLNGSGNLLVGTTTDTGEKLQVNGTAYVSGDATFAGKITANGAGSTFKGTTTNDNAATGYVGEYVESVLSFSGRTTLTNATGKSVTSVSLTAGDWDLFGFVGHDGASATTTYVMGSFSTTNDTSNSTDYSFSPLIFTTSNFNNLMSVPTLRVSLSGTTTIYLVAESGFSAGTLKAWGRISARRVR